VRVGPAHIEPFILLTITSQPQTPVLIILLAFSVYLDTEVAGLTQMDGLAGV
jgi:hypothetical protein